MKKLLVGLTLLTSMSSFAGNVDNSTMSEILFLKSEISKSSISLIGARKTEKEQILRERRRNEVKINQLCGSLNEKLETREFSSDFKVEFAAQTIEGACQMPLPEGYSWELKY